MKIEHKNHEAQKTWKLKIQSDGCYCGTDLRKILFSEYIHAAVCDIAVQPHCLFCNQGDQQSVIVPLLLLLHVFGMNSHQPSPVHRR